MENSLLDNGNQNFPNIKINFFYFIIFSNKTYCLDLISFLITVILDSNEQISNNYQSYVPEFSLKIDNTQKNNFFQITYLKINRNDWLNAVRATQISKKYLNKTKD